MIDSIVFSKGRRRLSLELVAVPPRMRMEGKLRLTKANTRVLCRYEAHRKVEHVAFHVRSSGVESRTPAVSLSVGVSPRLLRSSLEPERRVAQARDRRKSLHKKILPSRVESFGLAEAQLLPQPNRCEAAPPRGRSAGCSEEKSLRILHTLLRQRPPPPTLSKGSEGRQTI